MPRNPDFSRSHEAERVGLLEDQSEDEDFFIQGPTAQPNRLMGDNKVSRLQGQVSEVVDVMQGNITRVMQRGDNLEDLRDKSDELSNSATQFRVHAKGLRNNMWWKECKMRILLAFVIIVVLIIIIVPIAVRHKD